MSIHERLANANPKLARGKVWCRHCGRMERVDAARALAKGWPKCCGYTMTVDAPWEQQVSPDQKEKP